MSRQCAAIWRELAAFMKPENMPFDGKRMIHGGFDMKVDM